jgi:ketosteroid isomerase-like protein
MGMVVSGSFAVQQGRISITAHIKDVATMKHIASAKMEGPIDEFFELRSRIALNLLERLRLELPASDVARILRPRTTNLEARKVLFEAEGAAVSEETPAVSPKRPQDRGSTLWRLFSISSVAYAEAGTDAESELRALLEEYRASFEQKDIGAVERYYDDFTDEQRNAIERYFLLADELEVVFTDIRVTASGDRAAVSFTRSDRFVDRDTGDPQEIRVRQTKTLARGPEGWRIVPGSRE